jgi:ketosteroid isomerase-like protein
MSTDQNKAIVHRYFEALSGKDKPGAVVDEFVAEEPLKGHIAGFETVFPHYELIADQMVAEGDMVSVIGRFRGTQKGELMGIPPTGKTVEIAMHITYRLAEGKIVDHWMVTDNLSMLQQLGAIPTPAAA